MMRLRIAGTLAALVIGLALTLGRPRELRLGYHMLHPEDALMRAASQGGAGAVIQVLSWREIEPTQGEFHWEYADWLVRAAEYYGLEVVARLDEPPFWATGIVTVYSAPPRDPARLAEFAGRVAERYRGRITGYIVWNEPNLAREWGYQQPDPKGYSELLRRTGEAIRAADPAARVVAAGLAPTNQNDAQAMDDRSFLRAMLEAGAAGSFDALAVHPYGFGHPPQDPRGAHEGLNFARVEDWRALLIEQKLAKIPLWITEFGYTTAAAQSQPEAVVSELEQAEFLSQAYRRAQSQYPYVELFGVWNLADPKVIGETDEQAGYSLLRADGTVKPGYVALRSAVESPNLVARVEGLLRATRPQAVPAGPQTQYRVLASDAWVHLGDSEDPAPWEPLYLNRNPSLEWSGQFYVREQDLLSQSRWTLRMELMQVNDYDNRVTLNGRPLDPPVLPTEDFAGVWVSARFAAPRDALRPGANVVRLQAGKLIPPFQQLGFTWDDFQVRNVRVVRETAPSRGP